MMKRRFLCLVGLLCLLAWQLPLGGEESTAATELAALVQQIRGKIAEGKRTPEQLADDIKQFDVLLEKHRTEKTDDVARILGMKAMLYYEIFNDSAKATEFFQKLQAEFPETSVGKTMQATLDAIKANEKVKEMQRKLMVGSKFPDFEEKDTNGKSISVASYKGKVVLIDFWATWCPGCLAELPNVLKVYEKYNSKGFEVIGISLDKDLRKLTDFVKARNVPWRQYFDEPSTQKLAQRYVISTIPATYLVNQEGVIIGKDLRGPELEAAVAKALAGKENG